MLPESTPRSSKPTPSRNDKSSSSCNDLMDTAMLDGTSTGNENSTSMSCSGNAGDSSSSASFRRNPFESPQLSGLAMNIVTPGLFQRAGSRRAATNNNSTMSSSFWSIEHLSAILPVEFHEDELMMQSPPVNVELEAKAHAAIENFWTRNVIYAPSPDVDLRQLRSQSKNPTSTTTSKGEVQVAMEERSVLASCSSLKASVSRGGASSSVKGKEVPGVKTRTNAKISSKNSYTRNNPSHQHASQQLRSNEGSDAVVKMRRKRP